MKKYIVRLERDEQNHLKSLINKGKVAARKILHARILLKADEGDEGEKWIDDDIAKAFDVNNRTVERIRERFVTEGLEAALNRKPQTNRKRKIDGEIEAHLVRIACSKAPEGRAKWTLRLLADKMVELNYVDSLSHEGVRQNLKKNKLKPWLVKEWCIPPKCNAEFVCRMEEVLEVYKRPYNPKNPVVCMDELTKQLIKETRIPIPAKEGSVEKFDTEYERNGTANVYLYVEPLKAKYFTKVTKTKTAVDWAYTIREMVDVKYKDADKITLVLDNLNTHVGASLYKVFSPQEARRLLDKIEFVYTPKHGSWLNIAEIGLSILSRQCLDRRIEDFELLSKEIEVWTDQSNNEEKMINWQFKTQDARIKLKKLYPTLQ